jgi:hypothetical protein
MRSLMISASLLAAALAFPGVSTISAAEPAKTRSVAAGDIKLTVPAAWKQKPASNLMRLAQFAVPKTVGDPEDAEFVVFFFPGAGGGADANVQRWIKQFQTKDRKVKVTSGKSPQGDYILVDQSGTWNKPVGRMIDQRTVEMPHARVLGFILTVKDQGNYFLRLTGPEKTVSANADAFRTVIGADAKSEKEYKLGEE